MPLDPSIFGMSNRPTVALQNPMDAAMQQMALQNQQMQMAQQQQALQDSADFKAQTGVSPGMAKHRNELATAEWRTQEAKNAAQDSYLKMTAAQRKVAHDNTLEFLKVATPLLNAKSPEEFQAGVQQAVQFHDGNGEKGWAQIAKDLNPQKLQSLTRAAMDDVMFMKQAFPNEGLTGWHEGVDSKTGKPTVYGFDAKGNAVPRPGIQPEVKKPLVQIGSLSPEDKAKSVEDTAMAYVQGRIKRPTGRELTDPILNAAWQRARQMDPTLSDSTIALRQNAQKEADTGKIGQSNNSISTVLGHLGHLKEVFNRLPDTTGIKGLNWLEGKAKEMGPGGNPDLQEVYDLVEGIGPEMAKAYVQGGGTEGERHGWKERINPFRPMGERKASLNAFASMLVTKLNQNETQYLKAFKGLSPNALPAPQQLSEDAYNALKSIQEWTGKPIPGADKWIQRYENGDKSGVPTYSAPGATPQQAAPTPKANYEGQLSPSKQYVWSNGAWKKVQ